MANEAQYYHPIIQAMIAAQQRNNEIARLDQQAQQFQAKQALDEQQFAEQKRSQLEKEKQIEKEFKRSLEMTDIAKKAADLSQQAHRLNLLKEGIGLRKAGGNVEKAFETAGIQGAEAIPSLEQLMSGEAAQIASQTQARLGTEEQFKIRSEWRDELRDNRKREADFINKGVLGAIDHGYALELSDKATERAKAVANINHANDMAKLRYASKLGSVNLSSHAQQLTDAAWLGQSDPTKWTPEEKNITEGYLGNTGELGGFPKGDFKRYNANLETLGRMQIMLNELEDLAANYSVDSPGNTGKGNYRANLGALGTHGFTLPGSELKSKEDSLKTRVSQLVETFQSDKRISDRDAVIAAGGSFDPTLTTKDNLAKIQLIRKDLDGIAQRTFKGMKPERAEWIQDKLGLNFNLSNTSGYTDVRDGPKGKIGVKGGKWYDISSGKELQ